MIFFNISSLCQLEARFQEISNTSPMEGYWKPNLFVKGKCEAKLEFLEVVWG